MGLVPIPLPTMSDPGRFGEDGAQRLVNVVLEQTTVGGKRSLAIYQRPGLVSFAALTAASGGVRAIFEIDNTLYAVAGRQVYQSTSEGSVTQLTGGIAADGPVRFARNMASIPMVALVAGGTLTILQGGTLTEVSDEDLPPPVDVAFLGGYLVYPIEDGRFFWSEINDDDVDALSFATAEYASDRILRTISHRNELFHFGATSIEAWGLTENADAPFGRVTVRDYGCRSAGSVCQVSNTLVWIDKTGRVVRLNGYDAERISHHAVERDIMATDPEVITSTSFSLGGHDFYVLNMPTRTWVFDVGYGWYEWKTRQYEKWNVAQCAAFNNRVIAGSSEAGTLYTIETVAYDDAGDDLVMSVRVMFPTTSPRPQRLSAVYCNLVTGRGLISGADTDTDPELMLAVSRDGGNTWPAYQTRKLGQIGDRDKDVTFRRLGLCGRSGTTIEISLSAAVGTGIVGLSADMDLAAA